MKTLRYMALAPLVLTFSLKAEQSGNLDAKSQPALAVSKMPWVGVEVGKLDAAMRAHATGVPEGIGFLVTSVTADGPADQAGVKSFDILWKLDDQLLVNEAQFGTLLQMHGVGDSVHNLTHALLTLGLVAA